MGFGYSSIDVLRSQYRNKYTALGDSIGDTAWVQICPVYDCSLLMAYQPVMNPSSFLAMYSTMKEFAQQSLMRDFIKNFAEVKYRSI